MGLDTANRQIDRGRKMRVFAGDVGPLPGVQAFEATSTEAIDRFGEYDSDEQIVDVQIPENSGFIEMLDTERIDFYRALMAADTNEQVVDVHLAEFTSPWLVCNVWNKKKTKYTKSAFVKKPIFNNHPYSTTLNDATMLRFEFSASKFVKLPQHAVAIDQFAGTGATEITLSLSKTAVQLLDGTYALGVAEKVDLGSTPKKFQWNELSLKGNGTSSSVTVVREDGTEIPESSVILVYYAYKSSVETGTWPGQTV